MFCIPSLPWPLLLLGPWIVFPTFPPLSKQKERYHLPIMSYVIIYDSLKILIITQFPDILCVIKCQEKCHKGAYYTSPSIIAEVVQLQSQFSGALITHKF